MSPAPLPSLTKTWHTEPYPAIDPSRPELSLSGKVAVITGAAGSIGFATASAFARAGIRHLALLGRTEASLDKAKSTLESTYPSTTVSVHPTDITSAAAMTKTMQSIRDLTNQPLDILVANAGYMAAPGTIAQLDVQEFSTALAINATGAFISFTSFLPVASSNATVINVNSGVATLPANDFTAGIGAYAAGKAAGAKLFEYIAFENPGLRVFTTQPGVVYSELNRKHGMAAMDHADLPGWFHTWLCSEEGDFLRNKFVWVNWDVDELKGMQEKIQGDRLTLTLDGWPFDKGL